MSFRSIQSESSVDDDDDEKEYFGSKGDQEAFKEMIHQHTLIEENHDDVFDSPSQIRESTREDIIPAISVLDADIERVKGVLMTNTIKMCSRVEAPMRLKEVHVEYACRIEDGISDTTTLEWIRNNISQRVCCLPVRTYRDKDNNDVCFCYKKCVDHHDVIGDTKSLVWTKDNNTTTVATDAFGDVRVHADDNSFEGKLKYVRVDEEMTMTLLQQLLFDKWRLNKPDWILTVMGEVSANSKGQKQFWTLLADTIGRLSTKKGA
ncbi:uncharacterized protein LOC121379514 [Gigantopelta aegis]|uniref:uncharacterized protein LOC121379514 n=1 Tax=Gigantopelta aegis TaxID=1735272 RepID=UPI001B889886|nr:uncharacterized protein LOC121379514 [Gigantopelta aegis]